jgi:hypothetical protein
MTLCAGNPGPGLEQAQNVTGLNMTLGAGNPGPGLGQAQNVTRLNLLMKSQLFSSE